MGSAGEERAVDARRLGSHVVLIGPMGSGKTTVGELVAGRLDRPFRDNDAELEEATGMTARALEEEYGTTELHHLERMVLNAALAHIRPSVVAAAASVVDSIDDAALAPHLVVYLRSAPGAAQRRAGIDRADRHRPQIRSTSEAHAVRDRRSAELADVVIDVDERSASSVADRISVIDLGALTRQVP